jgi:hypothetical protein
MRRSDGFTQPGGMMMAKSAWLLLPVFMPGLVRASGQVFLGSPYYDIMVTLEYTDEPDPYLSQGYIARYRSVSLLSHVKFGPSFSPEFPAMFAVSVYPSGQGGEMPGIQVSGTGAIEYFELQPAWESDDPIEAVVVHGPEGFSPYMNVITTDMAAEIQGSADDDMPTVPLVPTLWFLFSENFSIADPELQWEYPGFAGNGIASSVAVFSVPLARLGEGESFEIGMPYESETARGQWTIRFTAED